MPMQRIVGRVEIEDDLFRGRLVRLQEQRDEEPFNGCRVMADLVIPRRSIAAELKPVECRLARHRRAVRAPCLQLAGQHRHHRIMAQLVVIIDVLIAERHPEHPLSNQRGDKVLDIFRASLIDEASGKAPNQPDRAIRRSQQQGTGIRRDRSTVKSRHHGAAFHRAKLKQFSANRFCATLCRHRGAPRIVRKSFSQKNFR